MLRPLFAGLLLGLSVLSLADPLPRKGTLGVAATPVPPAQAKELGLKPNEGFLVSRTVPGSTGEQLGLQPGDVMLRIGSARLGAKPLGEVVRGLEANRPIAVTIRRGAETKTLTATLQERARQKSENLTVVYDSFISKGKRIRLIATHPNGPGPYPTLFLIGGIGANSVDGNFESVPYGNVLGPVAAAGFATVRIDKPGQGDSEGPAYADLRFGDELDAYLQGVRHAKKLPFVDAKKIAIFGHSMGGAFGPIVAAQESVAGLSANGTMSKTWVEYMLENSRRQSAMAGTGPAELDTEMRTLSAVCHHLFNEGLSPAQIERRYPPLKATVRGMIPDGKTYSGVGIQFFQELARQNLIEAWAKAKCSVLVTYGENDFIATRFDHEFIVDVVNKLRPGTARLEVLAQSDHGFFQTTSPLHSMQNWGRGLPHNPSIESSLIAWLRTL
jgi:hypothetical protein